MPNVKRRTIIWVTGSTPAETTRLSRELIALGCDVLHADLVAEVTSEDVGRNWTASWMGICDAFVADNAESQWVTEEAKRAAAMGLPVYYVPQERRAVVDVIELGAVPWRSSLLELVQASTETVGTGRFASALAVARRYLRTPAVNR